MSPNNDLWSHYRIPQLVSEPRGSRSRVYKVFIGNFSLWFLLVVYGSCSWIQHDDHIDDQIEGTKEQSKGTDDQTDEGSATQTTQPPASIIFRDDETIAQVLLNMSQAKAVSREKEKGVELS
ncbi:hypothetical protein Tco_0853159 [Tanacetum coccineum]